MTCLKDGRYACGGTLHIENGKAIVVLHDTFGLAPGTTIPLARKECNLVIEETPTGVASIKHGTAII